MIVSYMINGEKLVASNGYYHTMCPTKLTCRRTCLCLQDFHRDNSCYWTPHEPVAGDEQAV
jgi:hypothetical protein